MREITHLCGSDRYIFQGNAPTPAGVLSLWGARAKPHLAGIPTYLVFCAEKHAKWLPFHDQNYITLPSPGFVVGDQK